MAFLLLLFTAVAHADLYRKWGYVQARGQVLGPNDQPVLVEVDPQGNELQEIGEVYGPLEGVFMMSGFAYRTAVEQYNQLIEDHREGAARGAVILGTYKGEGVQVSEYESYCQGLPAVKVPAPSADAEPVEKKIPCPVVEDTDDSGVRSVVLRHPSTILDPDLLGEDGPILLKSPIDLRDRGDLDPEIKTVLLTPAGQIARQAQGGGMYENTVTYKWNYFQPDGEGNQPTFYGFTDEITDRVLSPLPGVKVSQALSWFGFTQSDEDGKYRLEYYLPPCPCFTYDYNGKILGEVPYKNFNPKSKDSIPFGTYTVYSQTFDFCNGMAQCFLYPPLLQSSIAGIIATQATPMQPRQDLKVDAVMLTGEGRIDVPIGDTAYDQERASFNVQNPDAQLAYDFDGDRSVDRAVLHNNEYYVYLGGRAPEYDPENPQQPINEDMKRRPDYLPDFEDRGLLQSISLQDLEQTDLYVFRASTGQLILERLGLKQNEYIPYNGIGADTQTTDSANFYYKFLIRGPRGIADLLTGSLSDWWSKAGIKQELFEHNKADFLRAGEMVQIVAINRPTGYVGSVTAPLQLNNENEGRTTLDVPIDRLVLEPPNLKIRVERQTETQLGLTKGEINQYLIGSEGAGLQSDQYIKITTEWLNSDGTPLPEDLPGYSGLLAKVVAPGQVAVDGACGSQASKIPIKPGFNLQLLKLNGDCDIRNEHYYLYVCGNNPDDTEGQANCFDFGTQPDGRPSRYVPVKVPVFDEINTRKLENAYRYARKDNLLLQGTEAPEPVHQWAYRSEMQFSVYKLEQAALKLQFEREEGQIQTVNLKDVSPDLMGDIFAGQFDYVNFFYGLLGSENQRLETFGPSPGLEFSLGEDQLTAVLTNEGQLQFAHLDHFARLDPVDHLALRLYSNNDTANVLWEWVFSTGLQGAPLESFVSADEPQLELVAYLPVGELDPDEPPKNVTVTWQVQGPGGSLSQPVTQSSIGLFTNTLITQRQANDEYTVTATITASDDERFFIGEKLELGPFKVVPGEPSLIELQSSTNTLQANELSRTAVSAVVYDAHDNRVSDGTPVTWQLDYDGELQQPVTETTNGVASVEYEVGDKLLESTVVVQAGSAEQQFVLTKTPVTVDLSVGITNLPANEVATTTLSVTSNAVDGTSVEWNSTHGRIINAQDVISNGQASATLVASRIPGEGTVMVSVAEATDSQVVEYTGVGGLSARFEHAAIVAANAPGSVSVDTLDGTAQHNYITSTNVIISGEANEELTLEVGGFFTPNALPRLHLAMDGIIEENPGTPDEQRYVGDLANSIRAEIMGNVEDDLQNGFTRPGSSLAMQGGYLTIEPTPLLEISNDLFVNVRFRTMSDEEDQQLVFKGNGIVTAYALTLINGGTRLRATVTTDQGTYSVDAETSIQQDTWYIAGIRVRNGRLELGLNDERKAVAISGQLLGNGSGIALGSGFEGNLDDIKIGRESLSDALLVFGDGSSLQNITLDASGSVTLPVRATGNDVGANGHVVGFTARQGSGSTTVQMPEQSLNFANLAMTTLSTLMGVNAAYAQPISGAQESGLALASPAKWGAVAEWVGRRIFGDAFDTVKRVAQFVFELTAISDIYVLAKALVSFVRSGNIGDTDAFEITFATIGIGITVLTVFTGGAAAPLKFGLIAIKPVLRELFQTGLRDAIKVGILTGKFLFSQIKLFVTDSGAALKLIADSAKAFGKVIADTTGNTLRFFFRMVRSLDDLLAFIKSGARGNELCAVIAYNVPQSFDRELAQALGTALFGSYAYAQSSKLCGDQLFKRLVVLANDVQRFGGEGNAAKVAANMTKITNFLADQGRALTDEQLQGLIEVGIRRLGNGSTQVKGLEQLQAMLKGMSNIGELERATRAINRIAQLSPRPEGFDRLLAQAASGNINDVRGALHVLSDIDADGIPIDQIKAFEEVQSITIIDAAGNKAVKRRFDLVLKDNSVKEYKAWEAGVVRWTRDIQEEFIKDILSGRSFQWIIHRNSDINVLRDRMLCLLGSGVQGNGKPCAVDSQLLNSLGSNASEIIDDLIFGLKNQTENYIRHGKIADEL